MFPWASNCCVCSGADLRKIHKLLKSSLKVRLTFLNHLCALENSTHVLPVHVRSLSFNYDHLLTNSSYCIYLKITQRCKTYEFLVNKCPFSLLVFNISILTTQIFIHCILSNIEDGTYFITLFNLCLCFSQLVSFYFQQFKNKCDLITF